MSWFRCFMRRSYERLAPYRRRVGPDFPPCLRRLFRMSQ